jgi:hypothetical protein
MRRFPMFPMSHLERVSKPPLHRMASLVRQMNPTQRNKVAGATCEAMSEKGR